MRLAKQKMRSLKLYVHNRNRSFIQGYIKIKVETFKTVLLYLLQSENILLYTNRRQKHILIIVVNFNFTLINSLDLTFLLF